MSKDKRKIVSLPNEQAVFIANLSKLLKIPENSIIKMIIFEYMNKNQSL